MSCRLHKWFYTAYHALYVLEDGRAELPKAIKPQTLVQLVPCKLESIAGCGILYLYIGPIAGCGITVSVHLKLSLCDGKWDGILEHFIFYDVIPCAVPQQQLLTGLYLTLRLQTFDAIPYAMTYAMPYAMPYVMP